MDSCADMWFKQHAIIVFLTVVKIPFIDIYHCMQAIYVKKCANVAKVRHLVEQFN